MPDRFSAKTTDRLDKVIADQTKYSRKRARRLIESGGVWVDGKRAKRSSQEIAAGSRVEVRKTPTQAPDFTVLYEDGAIVVVDKPCGVPTQSTVGGRSNHLFAAVKGRYPYVGLHHRLDTPVSGCVLFTVDRAVNKWAADGFAQHAIKRIYEAVVVGAVADSGTWEGDVDGRSAVTRYQALGECDGTIRLRLELETGRRHQIRRHAQENQTPIVGDRRYGGSAARLWPRMALHATAMSFEHPRTGLAVTVTSPIPEDLAELWRRFESG